MRKSKFFQPWDPRALAKYLQYGLRNLPTAVYPETTEPNAVTLTTTKHQESWSYVRPNFSPMLAQPNLDTERLTSPDLNPEKRAHIFHRAEMVQTFRNLPSIRPSVLWVFGAESHINTPASRDEKLAFTGTGIGGSGGSEANKVECVVVEKSSHMLPFEKIHDCASILARWLERETDDFEKTNRFYREHSSGKSEQDMLVMSKLWLKNVRRKPSEPRTMKGRL